MQIASSKKDIMLDCSIDRFVKNGIPEEDALVLLKHLCYCIGKSDFKLVLKTEKVFGDNDTQGFEEGGILCKINPSTFEPITRVEHGGICLAFLFFSNAMSTKLWQPVPRRGEGYDYICYDSQNSKIVVEAGGRTSRNGARIDLNLKKTRFQRLGIRKEKTYISSVGFKEGEHIVHKYN